MAKTEIPADQLRKGAKVVARADLRDVPEGTAGKVILIAGFAWVRYWVRFDNGVYLGSIDRSALATADEWKRHRNGEDVFAATTSSDVGDGETAGGGESAGGGGGTTKNGTFVPQHLLDKAKAARARLAA